MPKSQPHSPNLLRTSPSPYNFLTKLFKRLTIVTQLVFLFVIALNYKYNSDLSKSFEKATELRRQIESKSYVFADARSLSNKISIYKRAESQRSDVAQISEGIYSKLSPDIRLILAHVTGEEANIVFETDDALTVATFISRLLSDDSIKGVSIESAVLSPTAGTFITSLEVLVAK